MTTTLVCETRTARKRYVCDYCLSEYIEPGEAYHYSKYVDNGLFWTFRAHRFCKDFAESEIFSKRWWCGSDTWAEFLHEWLEEQLGPELYEAVR